MAEYCTVDDMIDRFGESELASITDRSDAVNSTVDDDLVVTAIRDASSIIDGGVLAVYEQPVKPFPDVIKLICCDIARWLLYEDSLDEDNIIQRRYDRAIKMLESISSGEMRVTGLVKIESGRLRVIRA